jgi:hypothetical protein
MEINVDALSIPSSIHDVERPVPVPSSRNFPFGFDAASVFNKEHVSGSDAMVNAEAFVARSIDS